MSDPKDIIQIPTLADQTVAQPANPDLSWTQDYESSVIPVRMPDYNSVRAAYSEILTSSDDPYNDLARAQLADYLAPILKMPKTWVADNLDTLAPLMSGLPAKPQGFLAEVGRAFEIGTKQVDLANRAAVLMAQVTTGDLNPKDFQDAKALYDELNVMQGGSLPLSKLYARLKGQAMKDLDGGFLSALKLPFDILGTLGAEATKATATQLPQLGVMAAGGGAGALAFGGVAALVGAGTPAEAATIPAGVLTGFWTGAGAAGAEQEAGQMYADLLFNPQTQGIDPKLAAIYSGTYGIIAGALEKVGLEKVPGVQTLLKKSLEATTAALISKGTLRQAVTENAKHLGKDFAVGWATETITESTQQAAQSILTELAKQTANQLQGANFAPEDVKNIVQDILDSGWQAALAYPLMGAAGVGFELTQRSKDTMKTWKEQGIAEEKVKAVVADVRTEQAIQKAQPSTNTGPIQTSVVDTTGAPITVYHAANQQLASGQADLGRYGSGVQFFTDRNRAETEAQAMSAGPLDPSAFLATLRDQYPQIVADAAAAVVKSGREAVAPFEVGLRSWADQNPTMDPHQIIDLAESIHTGELLADRNALVRHYGLEKALPAGGIIEAKIQADKAVQVDEAHKIDQAFKDGAQAVEYDGVWHVRDAQHVVVTGKTDSRTEAAVKNPVGTLGFQANDNTLRAVTAQGVEAGRTKVEVQGNTVRIRDLSTAEPFRRQGVAQALVNRIVSQHPGKTIDWGTISTSEGKAFQDAFRQKLPTWETWGRRIREAESRGETMLADFLRQKADTITDPADLNPEDKPLTADQLHSILSKGMTHAEADAAMAILERMAWSGGTILDELLSRAVENVVWVESVKDGSGTVRQSANGAAILGAGGRRLIQLVQGRANVTTVLHEMAHVLRPLLSLRDQDGLLAWTGESEWNRTAEERFARGFEQYLGEGHKTGDEEVDGILAKLANWFRLIYDALFNDPTFTIDGKPVELTDEARHLYGRIVQGRRGPEDAAFGKLYDDWDAPLFQEDFLAPNGKPSRLTPRQYTQVRTAAFKAWFGDWENDQKSASKVVDENGEPMAVWHGTPDGRFLKVDATFKSQKERTGIGSEVGVHWFAEARNTAVSYADDRRAFDYQNAEPTVIQAFLNLRNPLVVDGWGENWRTVQRNGKTSDVVSQAIRDGNDGVLIRNVKDDYNNNARTRPTLTATVFSSNQIKSATDNTGPFDPTNPSILFQDGDTEPSPFEVKRLDKALEFAKNGDFSMPLPFGRTPAILRSFGTPDLELVMPVSKLRAVMGADGLDGGHGITLAQVKKLQADLFDPAMVIVSRKDPSRILVFTNNNDDQGRPILAVIQRDGLLDKHRTNVITSIYGRQGAKGFIQEEIDRGGVVYLGNEKDGLSKRFSLNWTKRGTLPSGESMMTREEAVKGETRTLFQDDEAILNKQLGDKEKRLAEFKKGRESYLAKRSAGKTSDEKRTLATVVDEYINNLEAEIESDRKSVDDYRASLGKLDARKQAIKEAVDAGRPVPDEWIQNYQAEPWAKKELDRRTDLRDQLEEARAFDNLDSYLESIVENRVLDALGDPFDSPLTEAEWSAAEKKAREESILTPEEHERFSQVFGIAHAKTPEQLDKEFSESLTPEKVKMILAGMNQGGYVADKNLPYFVTAQVSKSYEGGTINESEVPRILKAMKNDPRTYRRIAQQGFADLAELEALSLEQDVEKATSEQAAEDAPPVIKPIEIPSDLNIEDKVAIRMGTKSRMEWQRKALDAAKEHDNLERAMTTLEMLSDRWTSKAETVQKGESELGDLEALAVLGQQQYSRIRSQLSEFAKEAGGDRTQSKDRVVKLVAELTKHIRGMALAKEAARRAYAAQAEEMRKMGAYLAKPAPKTIYVDEARLIELKRAMIDPHFRTMKKAELLELEAEWYKAHPDAIVPKNRRGELFGKNLNLWTYDELHAAFVERKSIEDRGRAHMIAKKLTTETRRYDLRQKILDAVFNEGAQLEAKIKDAEAAGDTVARARYAEKYLGWEIKRAENLRNLNEDKAARFNRGASSYLLTISNLADKLDGMADFQGINHKMLWSDPNAAENSYLHETDRRKVKMFQWIRDNKINLGALNDRVKIEGLEVPFSLDGLLTLYVGEKNQRKNMALRFGNKIDQRAFDYVNKTPELKWLRNLGDRIIQEYDENKDRLFNTAAEYDNIDLWAQQEEAYTPMSRTEVNLESMDAQLQWEAGAASAVRSANIEHKFTEHRIDIGKEHQKPIKLGEFRQWLDMVTRQEQYIAYTPVVKDLKALYTTGDVKDSIVQTYGKSTWQQVDNYIKSLANRYYDKTFTPLDRIMAKLSGNAALAYMAYNLGTVLKQLSSLPLFIAHARPDFLILSMLKMANPMGLIKHVDSLSIQMKTRVGYAELDDLRLGGNPAGGAKTELGTAVKKGLNDIENAMHRVADPGMKPMQWLDKLVAAAGWDASFETAKAKGLTEDAAIEYADWVVGKTQQSTHAKDTAGIMRDNNSLVKAMSLFAGPSVKVYNEMVYGIRANLKNGHYLKSFGTLAGISMASLVFYSLGKGEPPKDDEWYQWILLGMLNQIPIAGGAAAQIFQGYDAGNIILNQAIQSVVKTSQSLNTALDQAEAQSKREAATGRAAKSALDLVGLGFGMPVTPGKRIWTAFETANPGELVGWHSKQTN